MICDYFIIYYLWVKWVSFPLIYFKIYCIWEKWTNGQGAYWCTGLSNWHPTAECLLEAQLFFWSSTLLMLREGSRSWVSATRRRRWCLESSLHLGLLSWHSKEMCGSVLEAEWTLFKKTHYVNDIITGRGSKQVSEGVRKRIFHVPAHSAKARNGQAHPGSQKCICISHIDGRE